MMILNNTLPAAYTSPVPPAGDVMLSRLLLATLLLLPSAALSADATPRVWNYMGGANDDEGWGTLNPAYALCDTGHNQSPVGIGETVSSTMRPLQFNYRNAAVTIEKKDRTLVLSFKGAGTLKDEGDTYTLTQMRIHTPSEHQVIGKSFYGELHLIHRDAKGKILILAVFLDDSTEGTPALQNIIDHAPHVTHKIATITLNPDDVLPMSRGYYAYPGSLSWPPCTEGVEWRVLKDPILISHEQMKAFGALLGRNARLLQPLYFRDIRESMH